MNAGSVARGRAVAPRVAAAILSITPLGAAAQVAYPAVLPGQRIEFPRDEGSHPQFRTEWWYLTGWLRDERGDPLGFQLTFFRTRPGIGEDNPSRFSARQLLFAHVAVSDPKRGMLIRGERSARAGFGLACAAEGSLDVRIDDWSIRADGALYRATAATAELRLELQYRKTQEALLQGEQGLSRKGPQPASASYYYSLPQLLTSGRIVIGGRERRVQGRAWFDHEWSSTIMDDAARGWDWVGLNLDDGGALMAFQMRDHGGREYWAGGTLRTAAAVTARSYAPDQVQWSALRHWRSPRTGVGYPIEWKIVVGERTIVLRPLMEDQENDARGSTGTVYWEGAVRAFSADNRPIGRGYLELTGYGSRVKF